MKKIEIVFMYYFVSQCIVLCVPYGSSLFISDKFNFSGEVLIYSMARDFQ
ncbi:hypothetical protein CFter6_1095 [Collimonas fungivorans]|uniref:Uncharacterized protein n=1 Tax=Collimonas fungivorans TaxID=158899 RepID=A0A127P7U9_9BURK|nr:hypothetical protein CFter6_1095 [Collimonas fungivorans]